LLDRRQFRERRVEREPRVSGDGLDEPEELAFHSGPGSDGTLAKRKCRIAQEQRGARSLLDAEALARRAPAERAVERVVVRTQRLDAAPEFATGKVLTVAIALPLRLRLCVIDPCDVDHAPPEIEPCLHRLGNPPTLPSGPLITRHTLPADDDAIDHHL